MKPVYIRTNGDPIPEGACVTPDHVLTTFTITVRSLSSISWHRMTSIIQNAFEVTECEKTKECFVVK